ncbi:MAG TPA: OST-HTH/LOTUS domain-containing protein, partial [Bacillota bacterium]|nr:OST-HTH/LOTUS domain-containing protein [Bacillota bacterium]
RIGARTKAAEKDDKTKEPASEKPDKTPEKDSRTGKYTPKDIGIISFDEDDELPEAEVTSVDTIVETLRCILAEESDDDGWVATSDLGNRLLKRYSDFDVRNYGFTKLTSFLKSLKGFEMKSIKSDNSNVKHVYLRELLPDRE